MSNNVENVLGSAIDGIKKMIDVNTVIGDPVKISDNTTIIPVSKVSIGFVSGGSTFGKQLANENFGGGAGGGVKVTPIAFLTVTDDNVRLVSVSDSPDSTDKIFTKIPELIDQISGLIAKKKDANQE